MKISAFTIIKNATKFDYPIVESIKSLEPFVDEYVINLGDSEDNTDDLINSNFANNPKFKIFKSVWEGKDQGMAFFRNQTNKALAQCTGDWCFYLQADEAVHEDEMKSIRDTFAQADAENKKAIVFNFYHFEKNYTKTKKTYSEGFDAYEQEIRAFKNGIGIFSHGDAMGFAYSDLRADLKSVPERLLVSPMHIYHYGYVKNPKTMLEKKLYLKEFYFNDPTFTEDQKVIENGKIRSVGDNYKYSRQLNDFTGTHPSSMLSRIEEFNKSNPELL
jgi:glycosyltransferase involved in cell wall biosynthesis